MGPTRTISSFSFIINHLSIYFSAPPLICVNDWRSYTTIVPIPTLPSNLSQLSILFDRSQEIADGVNKSAQAVQAAEAGIRQIGALAHQQTMCMFDYKQSLR